ncbi:hypothetical protein JZ751_028899, partial [Albula glossodonta]
MCGVCRSGEDGAVPCVETAGVEVKMELYPVWSLQEWSGEDGAVPCVESAVVKMDTLLPSGAVPSVEWRVEVKMEPYPVWSLQEWRVEVKMEPYPV